MGKRRRRSRLRPLAGLAIAAIVAVLVVALVRRPLRRARRIQRSDAVSLVSATPASVEHVVDGDTAYFRLAGGQLIKGRFAGINTPECRKRHFRRLDGFRSARCIADDEHYGLAAYRELRELLHAASRLQLDCVRSRSGRCRRGGYGRLLIYVRADGRDVAARLVRNGAAWTYTKYRSARRKRYCQLEREARDQRRGMWATPARMRRLMKERTRRWYADHWRRCAR